MLEVFGAAAREMSRDELLDLRLLFVSEKEHPSTVCAIDRELVRRSLQARQVRDARGPG